MRVLVTGATGFVASHAVTALLAEGHRVRVLARTPAKVATVLGPLGIEPDEVEVAAGDMTDPDAVGAALDGCDALLHAAAQLDFAPSARSRRDLNVDGVRTVVGRAVDDGLDPIVYTSTISAYVPSTDEVLTGESDLAEPATAYGRSKRSAEQLVRGWQADGAPITTFVIGGVYGPVSPHLDGSFAAVRSALETMMVVVDGGMGLVDVRDLAALLGAAFEPGRGPRRYMAGGRFIAWQEWVDALSEAVGRELPVQPMVAGDIVAMGREFDRQRIEGQEIDIPLSEEAALTMTTGVPTDDAPTLADLGDAIDGEYRPTVDTFRDTVVWMIAQGHLDPALAPALATDATARQDASVRDAGGTPV